LLVVAPTTQLLELCAHTRPLRLQVVDEVARLANQGLSVKDIATTLCKSASEKRHADNTTVIVLFFKWGARDTTAQQKV
jgi:serine/threonine protein phosphatase PrpC